MVLKRFEHKNKSSCYEAIYHRSITMVTIPASRTARTITLFVFIERQMSLNYIQRKEAEITSVEINVSSNVIQGALRTRVILKTCNQGQKHNCGVLIHNLIMFIISYKSPSHKFFYKLRMFSTLLDLYNVRSQKDIQILA